MTAMLRDAIAPEPRPDPREHAGVRPRRTVREHRPRLQLGRRDARGAEARRLRGHRGRVRLRPRRGEVRRHPVPRVGPPPVGGGDRRHRARDEVSRRRGCRRPRRRERRGPRAGLGQPRPASRHRARDPGPARVVAINHRAEDTDAEMAALVARVERARRAGRRRAPLRRGRRRRGGARPRGRAAVRSRPSCGSPTPTRRRCGRRCRPSPRRIYGASDITASTAVRAQIRRLQDDGYGGYPVCVAKTQYSFSTDPRLRGAPTGHVVDIREVRLAAGAEIRRDGLRRHDDDAGTAGDRRPRRPSTSTRTGGSSASSEGAFRKTE